MKTFYVMVETTKERLTPIAIECLIEKALKQDQNTLSNATCWDSWHTFCEDNEVRSIYTNQGGPLE